MLPLSKQKRNIMKFLINILAISFICLTFICCIPDPDPEDIKGTWKLFLSHTATDTFYYDDLRGIKIDDSLIYDCNFFNQFSPFMRYEYTYENKILNVRQSSFIFEAEITSPFVLTFRHKNDFVNVFIPYRPGELITVLKKGCFK